MNNETWFIGDSHVLTIFLKRTVQQVELLGHIAAQDQSGLLPTPLIGEDGPFCTLGGRAAILWKRINGVHFVGRDHSHKYPLPRLAHASVAQSFWKLCAYLVATTHQPKESLGNARYFPADVRDGELINLSDLPDYLQRDFIDEFLSEKPLQLKYPALVHGDMERQNFIHGPDAKVVGIVDVDALTNGDLLYEYAHCMMNFLFCDPSYEPAKAVLYIKALNEANIVASKDTRLLPELIQSSAAKDLLDFYFYDHAKKTDLKRLTSQYEVAIERCRSFFASPLYVSVVPHRPDTQRTTFNLGVENNAQPQ